MRRAERRRGEKGGGVPGFRFSVPVLDGVAEGTVTRKDGEGSRLRNSIFAAEMLRRLRGSEAVKKSRVAGIASARRPAARRADEAMLGHRGGGATKQMASSRRKTGRSGFFHSLSG